MQRSVAIYRSERKSGAYLYVPALAPGERQRDKQLAGVPEALLAQLGELTEVMQLELDAQRKLANADASRVLEQLEVAGYYLQMPPIPGAVENEQP